MISLVCPRCRKKLQSKRGKRGPYWPCPSCKGRAVAAPVIRRAAGGDVVHGIFADAKDQGAKGEDALGCPSCKSRMRRSWLEEEATTCLSSSAPPELLELDVCKTCQLIWFDAGEWERIASLPKAEGLELPAEKKARADETRRQQEHAWAKVDPERIVWHEKPKTHQYLLGLLGVPVEEEDPIWTFWPWITWGLLAALVAIHLLVLPDQEAIIDRYGFVPSEAMRLGGLTFISPFFLHVNWLHLLGNAYFLWVFGDNVEMALGRGRYLLLLLTGSVFGSYLHWMCTNRPDVPCIGASDAISAVLVFYCLAFPNARLAVVIWFRYLRFRAGIALLFWLGLQVLLAMAQAQGRTPVSAYAHLGGALVGFLAWLLWNKSPAKKERY